VVPIEEGATEYHQVDLKKLKRTEREALVEKALDTRDQENEILLQKIVERLKR
jgi:hypothetical protein